MNRTRVTCLAAFLVAGVSVPALAAWDSIGSVNIGFRMDNDVRRFDFGGPVEKLQFRAERSDIRCSSVTATFENGRTRQIFSGRLREGRATAVDLPGASRNIRSLEFKCGASERRGGAIQVMADVGRYRADWMRGPNWGATWAHLFNWGSNAVNDWKYAGDARFEGRGDSESTFTGWRGRGSDAIALKPIDANARCSQVTATFANGATQNLAVHNGDVLRQGEFNAVDLPGDRRNVTSLYLKCRATDARRVTVQIYTSK
ncbi:MAG TPA: hypothetical protein VGC36_09745 [Rhizomicrobium sp.]